MKQFVRTCALLMAFVGVYSLCCSAWAQPGRGADLPSPGRVADVTLGTAKVHIDYGAPSLRGRKAAGGELMPYDTWWRTGANEATTFETTADVTVGSLRVPAGKYTLVTLPSAGTWQLVICKHTGQWGTERFEADDLGRGSHDEVGAAVAAGADVDQLREVHRQENADAHQVGDHGRLGACRRRSSRQLQDRRAAGTFAATRFQCLEEWSCWYEVLMPFVIPRRSESLPQPVEGGSAVSPVSRQDKQIPPLRCGRTKVEGEAPRPSRHRD